LSISSTIQKDDNGNTFRGGAKNNDDKASFSSSQKWEIIEEK
jgi:hypothetical protein